MADAQAGSTADTSDADVIVGADEDGKLGTDADVMGPDGAGPGADGTAVDWPESAFPWCDGKGWCSLTMPFGAPLDVIGGTGPDDVWVGGTPGLFHFDGAVWVPYLDVTDNRIRDISCVTKSDCWAVTFFEVLHWDGASWQSSPSPYKGTSQVQAKPWGVWILGSDGIGRRTQTGWQTEMTPPADKWMGSFSIPADGSGWAVVSSTQDSAITTLFRLSGGKWQPYDTPPDLKAAFYALISANATGDVWVSALDTGPVPNTGRIWHTGQPDGPAPVKWDHLLPWDNVSRCRIFAGGPGEAWVSMPNKSAHYVNGQQDSGPNANPGGEGFWYDGASWWTANVAVKKLEASGWQTKSLGGQLAFEGLTALPSGALAAESFASGAPEISIAEAGTWKTVAPWPSNVLNNPPLLWGSGATSLWAAVPHAAKGTVSVSHWTGGSWAQPIPAGQLPANITAFGGTADNDLLIGNAGTVVHWDGVGAQKFALTAGATVHQIWAASGSTWFSTEQGALYRWSGTGAVLQNVPSFSATFLDALCPLPSGASIVLTDHGGHLGIADFAAGAWQTNALTTLPGSVGMPGLACPGLNDIWAFQSSPLSADKKMLASHWDGATWQATRLPLLSGGAVTAGHSVWLGLDRGLSSTLGYDFKLGVGLLRWKAL